MRKYNIDILKQLVEEHWNKTDFDSPVFYESGDPWPANTNLVSVVTRIKRKQGFDYNELAATLVEQLKEKLLSNGKSTSLFKLPFPAEVDFVGGTMIWPNQFITATFYPVGKYWWGDVEAKATVKALTDYRYFIGGEFRLGLSGLALINPPVLTLTAV